MLSGGSIIAVRHHGKRLPTEDQWGTELPLPWLICSALILGVAGIGWAVLFAIILMLT